MIPRRGRDRYVEPVPNSLIADLEEMLSAEFDRVPIAHVRRQLLRGARDLRGQIVPESLGEMLYILVRHRIANHRREGAVSASADSPV